MEIKVKTPNWFVVRRENLFNSNGSTYKIVEDNGASQTRIGNANNEKDADMISAAPDMYFLLNSIKDCVLSAGGCHIVNDAQFGLILKALAKAEGR